MYGGSRRERGKRRWKEGSARGRREGRDRVEGEERKERIEWERKEGC